MNAERVDAERFEIIEHTADVGLRAYGSTREETFEHATQALASILGAWDPGTGGERVTLEVTAPDLPAVLADWLEEVLYVHETRDAVVTDVAMDTADESGARGSVTLSPRGDRVLEGTHVKAITYHQLKMDREGDRWIAQVYVDV